MLSNEDELQERSGVSDVPVLCRNCKHLSEDHDGWRICWNGHCQCRNYEPMTAEDILSAENEGL